MTKKDITTNTVPCEYHSNVNYIVDNHYKNSLLLRTLQNRPNNEDKIRGIK